MIYQFPGLGSEYAGMATRFAAEYPDTFRRLMSWFGPTRADEILDERELSVATPEQELALQQRVHAMNLLWWHRIVSTREHAPAAGFCGHSLGFYAAAVAAGCLSEPASLQVLETVHHFCRRSGPAPGRFAYVVILAKGRHARELISDPRVEPLAVNTNRQAVLCATPGDFEAFAADHADALFRVSRVRILTPIHSASLDAVSRDLVDALADIPFADPVRPVWSHLTGRPLTEGHAVRREVARQVSRPVRWDLLIEGLAAAGYWSFTEVGPNRILTQMAGQIAPGLSCDSSDHLRRKREDVEARVAA